MAGDFESGGLKTIISGMQISSRRLKSNIEAIIEKFNHDDEINTSTLSHKDKGHDASFLHGRDASEDEPSVAETLKSESSGDDVDDTDESSDVIDDIESSGDDEDVSLAVETDRHHRCQKLHRNVLLSSQKERSLNTCCHQNKQVNEHKSSKTMSSCKDQRNINSAKVHGNNLGRKFTVAEMLKSEACFHTEHGVIDSKSPFVMDNQCHLCHARVSRQVSMQQHQQSLAQVKDSRVCKWVEASSKTDAPGAPVHYASCPPNIEQKYFMHHPNCFCHHVCNSCSHHSRVVFGQAECNRSYQFSAPAVSNHVLPTQQLSCCTRVASTVHCGHCIHQSTCIGNQRTESESNIRTSADAVCCQHQNGDAACHLTNEPSEIWNPKSGTHRSLIKRACAVWEEIHAEQYSLNIQARDTDSLYNDKPVSDSLSNSCQSEYGLEAGGVSDGTITHGKTIHSPQLLVPKINSFLKSGLDKTIAGDFSTRSFVETHSPGVKVKVSQKTVFTSVIHKKDPQNAVMFPPSYIDKFSPINTKRIDSDAPTLAHEPEVSSPLLMLKESMKTSRLKRHSCKYSPTSCSHSPDKRSLLPHTQTNHLQCQVPHLSHQIKPPKRRNILSHSPSSIGTTISVPYKLPSSSYSQALFYQAGSPKHLYTQKEYREYSPGDTFMSRQTSPKLLGNRASTPVNSLWRVPEHFLDETIPTIGAAAHGSEVDEKLYDNESMGSSIIAQADTLIEDSNSSDDVDLL